MFLDSVIMLLRIIQVMCSFKSMIWLLLFEYFECTCGLSMIVGVVKCRCKNVQWITISLSHSKFDGFDALS